MNPVIVTIIVATVAQVCALLGAVWSLSGRLSRMEERMGGMVTVRECSAQQRECARCFEHREKTGIGHA